MSKSRVAGADTRRRRRQLRRLRRHQAKGAGGTFSLAACRAWLFNMNHGRAIMAAGAALLLFGVLFSQVHVKVTWQRREEPRRRFIAMRHVDQATGIADKTIATASGAAVERRRFLRKLPKVLTQIPSSPSSHVTLTAANSTPPTLPPILTVNAPTYNANGPMFSWQSLAIFGEKCRVYYRGLGPEAFLCSKGQPLGIKDTDDPPTFPRLNNYMNALPESVRFRLPTKQEAHTMNAKHHPFVFPKTLVGKRFDKFEFQCYSQNTEDGILLAIFGAIGVTNRRGLEIAGGVGWENNVANLVVNFGFDALFFDGDEGNHRCANNFFKNHPATRKRYAEDKIVFSDAFVKKDDINVKIKELTGGWEGEIDIFSLDIDGVDYWIWDVLDQVNPRVVVVETQELWGSTDRYVIKYDEKYNSHGVFSKMGASLAAYVELAKRRGYRLVGCIRKGYNAFFVREDAVEGGLDVLFGKDQYHPQGCFAHVNTDWKRTLQKRRDEAIQRYSHLWVDPVTMKTLNRNSPKRIWSSGTPS
jgi:hypothetical protein